MLPATIVPTRSKKYPDARIMVQEEGRGWVRIHLGQQDEFGDLLLDFSGDRMKQYAGTQDGSPRVIVHAPGGSDAVIYIRIHDGKLIVTPEEGVTAYQEGESYVFKY